MKYVKRFLVEHVKTIPRNTEINSIGTNLVENGTKSWKRKADDSYSEGIPGGS